MNSLIPARRSCQFCKLRRICLDRQACPCCVGELLYERNMLSGLLLPALQAATHMPGPPTQMPMPCWRAPVPRTRPCSASCHCQLRNLRCIRFVSPRECSCPVGELLSDELAHAMRAAPAISVSCGASAWSTDANAHAVLASSVAANFAQTLQAAPQ